MDVNAVLEPLLWGLSVVAVVGIGFRVLALIRGVMGGGVGDEDE